MGHVSPGPLPQERAGSQLPRREHRGGRTDDPPRLRTSHLTVGAVGERIASLLLADRGYRVVGRNLANRYGEIDLLARDGDDLVVVEVKTVTGPDAHPLERIDRAKASRLWTLAQAAGASRVEYIGLRLTATGVECEWLPG